MSRKFNSIALVFELDQSSLFKIEVKLLSKLSRFQAKIKKLVGKRKVKSLFFRERIHLEKSFIVQNYFPH